MLQAVELETQTREDAWGLRFLNVLNCLRQLTQQGLAREIFLWGLIEVRWWIRPAAAASTMLPVTLAAPMSCMAHLHRCWWWASLPRAVIWKRGSPVLVPRQCLLAAVLLLGHK